MNLLIIAAVAVVMIALRFIRPSILIWMMAWWVAVYIVIHYGIDPPLPSSIIGLYMAITTLVLLAYLSATSSYLHEVSRSLLRFMVDRRYTVPLVAILVALPSLVAWNVYRGLSTEPAPPISSRTIHPPPPIEITFKGKKIDLDKGENPYRALETTDTEAFRAHVEEGRRVYFQNCVFCHGDHMEGHGLYAHGFDPIPANFNDPTTIAMLQETYLFWRIAKGGPGLPPESKPWASAMPAWEHFLSEEEIWDVILFLYDYTDSQPRSSEEVH